MWNCESQLSAYTHSWELIGFAMQKFITPDVSTSDSFGRKAPLEIQKYMKTAEEFRNNAPVIETSSNIVQRVDTKVCGHLCLFVLTSLMREHLSFQQVVHQLNYGYSQYYW